MSILKSCILENKYSLQNEIGKGSYGSVFAAINMENNMEVAIKQIYLQKTQISEGQLAEVVNLKKICNNHIVVFQDSFYDSQECSFNIVMERCHSSLRQLIKQKKIFTYSELKAFLVQITSAFLDLEKNKIMHLDLKPENILIATKDGGHYKICDFGCSQISQELLFSKYENNEFGTMEYLAPQQYLQNNHTKVRSSADIWSLGVILYEMLFWHLPFTDPSNKAKKREQIYHFYNSQEYRINFNSSNKAPTLIIELIKQMLRPKPIIRITWSGLKTYLMQKLKVEEHQFFNIEEALVYVKVVLDLHVSFAVSLKTAIIKANSFFWKVNKVFLLEFLQVFVNYGLLLSQQFMNSQKYRLQNIHTGHWTRCILLTETLKSLQSVSSEFNFEEFDFGVQLQRSKTNIIKYLQYFNNKIAQSKDLKAKAKAKFLYTFSEELCTALKRQKSLFADISQFLKSKSCKNECQFLTQQFNKMII